MEQDRNLIRDGWRSLKHGLADITLGFFYVARAVSRKLCRITSDAAHAHPFAFMFVEALVFAIAACLYIVQARAERDNSSRHAYKCEVSRDSLQIIVDSFIPKYGKQ